jgi:hypothetical protein
MKKSIFFILSLCLTGCSFIVPVILNRATELTTEIASDIPASQQSCVDILNSNISELSIRKNIEDEVASAFSSEDFEKLESYYITYRQRTNRTKTGLWKLVFFYSGIQNTYSNLISIKETDENSWNKIKSKISKWINLYPQSPSPYIIYSRFLIDSGWHFRGQGYSKEVNNEAWKLLDENVELARNNLENSKEISSVDPEWYTNMLEIAMLQGWSKQEVKELLQEALFKEAYYHNTYHAAFKYLQPKWHGNSFAELEQFARDTAKITSKCEGKTMYARLYWRSISYEGDYINNIGLDPNKVKWERLKIGFDDLITRFPDTWNINIYAKFACLAQDKTKTQELMDKIGGTPINDAWGDIGYDFSYCQSWASQPNIP